MVGELGDSKIAVNLPVTNVPGCIGSNANTLGLQNLQFFDMGTSGGPPDGTPQSIMGQMSSLCSRNTIPDGATAFPVQERSQRSQSLCLFLSHLIDISTW